MPEVLVNQPGYQALGTQKIPEAIRIFKFNVAIHPAVIPSLVLHQLGGEHAE